MKVGANVLLALLPVAAAAQEVPGIKVQAAASAAAQAAPPEGAALQAPAAAATPKDAVPAGLPPALHRLSPSAPLNPKERASASMAAAWRNHNDKPSRGEDGVLRWIYGASLPSVVCSPLQVCDIALQAGEVVSSIHIGDKERWSVKPGVTGFGAERVTHIIVKPSDAGLVTSMLVYTDKRTYSIKLIATQSQWTPMTAFTYPDTDQVAWADYGAMMSARKDAPGAGPAPDPGSTYSISGHASWRPVRVYSSVGRTYIEFPQAMQYGTAPALVGLANDGGWFSSPSEQMVRYRILGKNYVVDGVVDRAELVVGVGGGQEKVEIQRRAP